MISINTNLPAQQTLNSLNKARNQLAISIERMSSGFRVNSAKDDAAGSAIANRMTANLRASSTLSRGVSDGIGLMQVAEGGLDGINELLQRSRELAVQAATETLSDSDRASLNAEFKQLRAEIDRTAYGTEVFGKYPLAPTTLPAAPTQLGNIKSIQDINPNIGVLQNSGMVPLGFIPAGVTNFKMGIYDNGANDDIQIFTQTGEQLIGTQIGTKTWVTQNIHTEADMEQNVLTPSNGFDVNAQFNDSSLITAGTGSHGDMTFNYSGDKNPTDLTETITIDKISEPLFVMVTGSGQFKITELSWTNPPPVKPTPISTPTDIIVSASYGSEPDFVTIKPTPADSTSLGLENAGLDPIAKAREAMEKLQAAMNKVDTYRGQYGALTNRFEGVIQNLAQESMNTAAARSRILDADYAVESSNMARDQITQQAAIAVLAKANQSQQGVMVLLNQ